MSSSDDEDIDAPPISLSRRQVQRKVRRKRSWRRLRLFGALFGVFILLVGGAVFGYGLYLNSQIHRVHVRTLKPPPKHGVDHDTENILMVGSTSRCALTVQNPAYGLCSQGVNGVNSDVIMILHVNASQQTVSILSIPRDLFIPNARSTSPDKIDAALAQGPSQLVAAIETDFGIPIEHYVELNFDTFANVVDALGGINMYFPEPVYDAWSGLNVQTPGCHHLSGVEALQVVRARHLQYKGPGVTSDDPSTWPQEAQSDLARIRRDHEFLRVLAEAVSAKGLGNPLTDQGFVSAVVGQLTVDNGFSAAHMVSLVLDLHGVNVYQVPQYTLPVLVDSSLDYYFDGTDYGNVELPSEPIDQQIIDQFLGLPAATDTMTGGKLPPPSSVTVSVENGTGTNDGATDAGYGLAALGFNVVGYGDATSEDSDADTVVYYSSRTPAEIAEAQAVSQALVGPVILALGPTTNGAEVTVATGSNLVVNPPPQPSPSPTNGTPTTTSSRSRSSATSSTTTSSTTTTTTPVPANFSPPTPAVETLAPWDPRSCTPSGGPGP